MRFRPVVDRLPVSVDAAYVGHMEGSRIVALDSVADGVVFRQPLRVARWENDIVIAGRVPTKAAPFQDRFRVVLGAVGRAVEELSPRRRRAFASPVFPKFP